MKLSRLAALGAAATIVIAGCATTVGGVAGVDTAAVVTSSSESTSRTIQTPTASTTSRTSTTSTSTTSGTTSTSTTSSEPESEEWDHELTAYDIPPGLRAVSPDGVHYATAEDAGVCIRSWGIDEAVCPIVGPADSVFEVFSDEGGQLGVILTVGGLSSIWLVDMSALTVAVVGADGVLTGDLSAPGQFPVSSAVWSYDETAFLVQMLPAEGATTADLWFVSTKPSDPAIPIPVPAEIGASYPQMWDSTEGLLFVLNTGGSAGQMWWMDSEFEVAQIGTGSFNEGGTVLLQSLAPDGSYAMICNGNGATLGKLEAVDTGSGDRYAFLEGDETCQGAVFDPGSEYVAVAGPFEDRNLMTVFNQDTEDIPTEFDLEGPAQVTPPYQTWNAADIITVTPVDLTDPAAKVNIIQLDRG